MLYADLPQAQMQPDQLTMDRNLQNYEPKWAFHFIPGIYYSNRKLTNI
jgi:hypothetical protein